MYNPNFSLSLRSHLFSKFSLHSLLVAAWFEALEALIKVDFLPRICLPHISLNVNKIPLEFLRPQPQPYTQSPLLPNLGDRSSKISWIFRYFARQLGIYLLPIATVSTVFTCLFTRSLLLYSTQLPPCSHQETDQVLQFYLSFRPSRRSFEAWMIIDLYKIIASRLLSSTTLNRFRPITPNNCLN